ncbi:MAG: DUF5752 family protein [Deltaproteobacteria bacterium]
MTRKKILIVPTLQRGNGAPEFTKGLPWADYGGKIYRSMTFKADEPFIFYSSLRLVELTGVRAATLPELAGQIRAVGSSSIYYHTHHFVRQHLHLAPEPPNDFAYWVSAALGDERLAEVLSSVDIMAYSSIGSIRESLISIIEGALEKRPRLRNLTAPEGEEFDFLKSVSFVLPTDYKARDLEEFSNCLRLVSLDSIYFHMFEARLRLERPTNDFSNWLAASLGEEELAVNIVRIDPYTQTGEGIRVNILDILERRIMALADMRVPNRK